MEVTAKDAGILGVLSRSYRKLVTCAIGNGPSPELLSGRVAHRGLGVGGLLNQFVLIKLG